MNFTVAIALLALSSTMCLGQSFVSQEMPPGPTSETEEAPQLRPLSHRQDGRPLRGFLSVRLRQLEEEQPNPCRSGPLDRFNELLQHFCFRNDATNTRPRTSHVKQIPIDPSSHNIYAPEHIERDERNCHPARPGPSCANTNNWRSCALRAAMTPNLQARCHRDFWFSGTGRVAVSDLLCS
jgi:hypothetical protein